MRMRIRTVLTPQASDGTTTLPVNLAGYGIDDLTAKVEEMSASSRQSLHS
jgi:hypothetical protein